MGTREAHRAMRARTAIGALLASGAMLLVGPAGIAVADIGSVTTTITPPPPVITPPDSNGDISALAFIVLSEASQDTQNDLKAIMADVKAINNEKAAQRNLDNAEARLEANGALRNLGNDVPGPVRHAK